ncbi:MAG: hypothetical protein A3D16_00455 [Rhodobacterales bacterium RIFCSPHIGHO2_02_FULL_62_130]|nr:MAG: hypothetical protein A3D16_00455 [Rhodobacterales bacterium RIFCSPHIGHO2_02_FULL_62_130]OHC57566.1 MAG: hypothetical protein A3E48_22540 [Rhodobacterales bacterium RIFCSPHIGHO2_12_FULL_62_75]
MPGWIEIGSAWGRAANLASRLARSASSPSIFAFMLGWNMPWVIAVTMLSISFTTFASWRSAWVCSDSAASRSFLISRWNSAMNSWIRSGCRSLSLRPDSTRVSTSVRLIVLRLVQVPELRAAAQPRRLSLIMI